MHAALESPAQVRPGGDARIRAVSASRQPGLAATALAVAALLVIPSLSLADGLLSGTVAYERDTTVFYYPLMRWAAEQLHQGSLPLWTPQVFGGYPIFADGEIGLASPPVLLALLVLPPERAFVVLRLVHLWIAALGTFALVRAWGLPRSSGVLAGTVFTLGSFLQAQIHHENIIRTAAWLPLILALAERALRARTGRGTVRWTVAATVALGLAGLSLHSQMLAIDLLVLGIYGTMRWLMGPLGRASVGWLRRLWAVLRVGATVVALGLGLAAVQLAPLIELAGFSPRGSGIPYSESAAYSLTVPGLAQLIFPLLFRGPGNLQWGLWTHWESYLYIGLVPLVLGIVALACVRRAEIVAWAAVGALGLVLALGQYSLINLHYYLWLLPGLAGLRAPGRFAIIVILAGAMLAAYGLAWLESHSRRLDHAPASRSLRLTLLGLAGGLAGLAVLLSLLHAVLLAWPTPARDAIQSTYLALPRDSYPLSDADVYAGLLWATDLSNPHVLGALVGLALALGALGVWQFGPRPGLRAWRGWPALLIAVTAGDLLLFAWAIHPRAPLAELSAEPNAIRAIEQQPAPDATPPRLLASPVLSQVAADRLAPFGVQEANGYSSLQFIWHRDYLGRVLYVDDALLDLWNVRYVVDPAHFGRLSSYRGVDFVPQQALLHAPGGSAIGEATFALDPTSPVREVRVVSAMMGAVEIAQGTPAADVDLLDADGQVLAHQQLLAGRDTMDWAAGLPNVRPNLKHQPVESAGLGFEGGGSGPNERQLAFGDLVLDTPVQASSIRFRIVLPHGELAVYGAAVAGPDDTPHQLFARTKSKYREVYADAELRVLENTAALPRAFLVSSATVAPSVGTALSEMVHQPFDPRQTVILAADNPDAAQVAANLAGPPADPPRDAGSAAVTSYAADRIVLHTLASASALLVLSDTYYPGWTARVDGEQASVLRADVLFRVVPVPAGEHDVELRFEPASIRLGLLMSLAALIIVLGALGLAGVGRRQGRTTE